MGKLSFARIRNLEADIQVQLKLDTTNENDYEFFKKLVDHEYKELERFKKIADDPKRYHAPKFFRRFAFGEINGTITASAQPENCGITHPVENRRYSVRECARIQSFPDDYHFGNIPLQSQYKVIGNAVPPVLGWVIARALLNFLPNEE